MPERETYAFHTGEAADEGFSAAAPPHVPRETGGDGRPARAAASETAARAWRDRSARDLGIPVTTASSDTLAPPGPAVSDAPRQPGHIGLAGRISRSFGAAPAPALWGHP